MFYTIGFACFTKKELARMIDLIQKWILFFPVQIVKIWNDISICYSLLYMPEKRQILIVNQKLAIFKSFRVLEHTKIISQFKIILYISSLNDVHVLLNIIYDENTLDIRLTTRTFTSFSEIEINVVWCAEFQMHPVVTFEINSTAITIKNTP